MTIVEFLLARIAEDEAEFVAQGDTYLGHRGQVWSAIRRCKVEIALSARWFGRPFLRMWALPYAGHPDYNESWRP